MARFAALLLVPSTLLALFLGTPMCKAEDELSRACSSVFHKTTPNGESLRFRFTYTGNNRFRQLLTGDPTGSMLEPLPLPAAGVRPSSALPSFSCVLVFTAPHTIHRPQDSRILVRVSDLHLGSGPFGCSSEGDAVRVYSVLGGRLFLVREFCGNDNYAPAIITESHMAVVTITLFGSFIEQEMRRFHLNVEAYKNIFQSVSNSKPAMTFIPEIANLNMYELMQQQQDKPEYEWNKFPNQYSEWGTPPDHENNWANALPNGVDGWNIYIPNERWKRLVIHVNKTEKA